MQAIRPSMLCRSVAMLLLLAAPAAAAGKNAPFLSENPASCWEKVYDAEHLAANPAQKTRSVRLFVGDRNGETKASKTVDTIVYFTFRGIGNKNKKYLNASYCKVSGNGLTCPPDMGPSGRWTLHRAADGDLLLTVLGVYLNPNDYDAEDLSPDAVKMPAGAADRTFKLQLAARSACD